MPARIMLDEFLVTALIFLILTHGLLIRKCFDIQGNIPVLTNALDEIPVTFEDKAMNLEQSMGQIRELLDEALDFISDFSQSPAVASPQNMSMAELIPQLLLSRLMPSTNMAQPDANPQKQEEWEILPPNNEEAQ